MPFRPGRSSWTRDHHGIAVLYIKDQIAPEHIGEARNRLQIVSVHPSFDAVDSGLLHTSLLGKHSLGRRSLRGVEVRPAEAAAQLRNDQLGSEGNHGN